MLITTMTPTKDLSEERTQGKSSDSEGEEIQRVMLRFFTEKDPVRGMSLQ